MNRANFLIAILILLSGCSSSLLHKEDSSVKDVIEAFEQKGYKGEFKFKMYALIGAVGGGSYSNRDFGFEIYKFESKDKAKSAVGSPNSDAEGYYMIIPFDGDKNKILSDFKSL